MRPINRARCSRKSVISHNIKRGPRLSPAELNQRTQELISLGTKLNKFNGANKIKKK